MTYESEYKVNALNTDGSIATGEARFTTVVAAAPVILHPVTTKDAEGEVPVIPFADLNVRLRAP